MRFKKIAVLFGGNSSERYISLKSGINVVKALNSLDLNVHPIDLNFFSLKNFINENYDKVFIALHGKNGEDGSIQGMLEFLNIPYTGSGIWVSSLSIDKFKTKSFLCNFGINTVPGFLINKTNISKYYISGMFNKYFCEMLLDKFGSPLIIKPNNEGSSIGISLSYNTYDLNLNLKKCYLNFNSVLVEKFIFGKEYTVGILNGLVLPIIRIKYKKSLFYDYNSKYNLNKVIYICPSDLNKKNVDILNNISINIWNILGCKDVIRLDFILDKNNKFMFLELNTIPGMTLNSLLPLSSEKIGINFVNLVKNILF